MLDFVIKNSGRCSPRPTQSLKSKFLSVMKRFAQEGETEMKKVMCAILAVFVTAVVQAAPFVENFTGYSVGTVLAGRDADGVEYASVNGFHSSLYYSGDRNVTVMEDGVGGMRYMQASTTMMYWKHQQGSEITSAITENPIVVFEFTKRWNTGAGYVDLLVGKMNNDAGTSFSRAFEFYNPIWNYLVRDAAGSYFTETDASQVQNGWEDVKLVIDPAANAGDGRMDVYGKLHANTVWTQFQGLSNINLSLKSSAVPNPSDWTDIFFETPAGNGAFSSISAYSIPEPTTLGLLALGGLFLRKRK